MGGRGGGLLATSAPWARSLLLFPFAIHVVTACRYYFVCVGRVAGGPDPSLPQLFGVPSVQVLFGAVVVLSFATRYLRVRRAGSPMGPCQSSLCIN
jgi:hypothetical protein